MLALLTVTTGLVDAVNVLGLGHVFAANQTGNVVFAELALAGSPGLSLQRLGVPDVTATMLTQTLTAFAADS